MTIKSNEKKNEDIDFLSTGDILDFLTNRKPAVLRTYYSVIPLIIEHYITGKSFQRQGCMGIWSIGTVRKFDSELAEKYAS